ncbi:alpha-L-fucosidase [Kutzneria buriramensis]|uniref:alpha-L-fucosidase n=1 Tax=Kutzneria buriramensis TaxID=1045776 RepID=A0A3E0GTJ6_9PSEU|nr:alpha-L-fucosidase [Kutzneria buriramensis]REH26412.1 alpha-L-fucosidase [Kutzneria buriramensis]
MSPAEPLPRRRFLAGAAAAGALSVLPATAAAATGPSATPTAATPTGVPLPALRVPQVDLGLAQQPDATVGWLADAKIGLFIHWGVYAGPAQGEWYERTAQVKPSVYRGFLTTASPQQFTADQYEPAAWVELAKTMGAKYVVLTSRHHEGFGLYPNSHPNAWTSAQAPLNRDFVAGYVSAVRAAGLKVGLYYSPIDWRYPGYYNVTGATLPTPPWNYEGADPASFDYRANARVMKEEVYQAVKQLVSDYGPIDDLWWDGGWLAEQGSDADGAFFWEPGQYRDPANQWPVGGYGETEPATGKPLGLMGMVRAHQPTVVVTPRSGWAGDYGVEEGGSVPTGPIRAGVVEKTFTIRGAWGYTEGASVMSYDQIVAVVVNALVRNMTTLINVGPDRHGAVPADSVTVLTQVGTFLSDVDEAVYGTRGGPWNPVDGKVGYTFRDATFYVHLLPGQPSGAVTTPPIGDAQVRRVYAVPGGQSLPYTVGSDGTVTITGIDRTVHPQDTVVAVVLDRPVVATDIAVGRATTADSEEKGKGNTAAHATDGDTATRWCAADGATGHWLHVDLGAVTGLTGARIAWEFPGKTYRYRIEGSTDGRTWSTVVDRTNNSDTSQVHTLPFTATARHLRVTVTGLDTGCWASIREFQAYDRLFS